MNFYSYEQKMHDAISNIKLEIWKNENKLGVNKSACWKQQFIECANDIASEF